MMMNNMDLWMYLMILSMVLSSPFIRSTVKIHTAFAHTIVLMGRIFGHDVVLLLDMGFLVLYQQLLGRKQEVAVWLDAKINNNVNLRYESSGR